MTRIVCLSDTHLRLGLIKVPDGDVLVHAGDLTFVGDIAQTKKELDALAALPHQYKILIAGNHDWLFQREPTVAQDMCLARGLAYLQDSGAEFNGIKIYGSPWQPEFCNWAFNLSRDDGSLAEVWAKIPDDTNVLVTHGPPKGMGDLTTDEYGPPEHAGCYELRQRIASLPALKLHVFGHIHSGYGRYEPAPAVGQRHLGVNASICNERYEPVNAPIVVEL